MTQRPWNLILPIVFAVVSSKVVIEAFLDPRSIGSHAVNYTAAAAAWLSGGDPWTVGPPSAVFGGPPPMLLVFVPFVPLPMDLVRIVWVVGSAVLALWVLRRLGLPAYWIAFPPIFGVIELGHPEVLVLWLLVLGGTISGLAAVIKVYAAAALVAERRWAALALFAGVLVVTALVLPWGRYLADYSTIAATFVRQNTGDSVFGQPILMLAAVIALASFGLRRALWLATPLLLPLAQPPYNVVSVPQLSPIIALFWAIPIPGATLVGVVAEAVLLQVARRRTLPDWLRSGLGPMPYDFGGALTPITASTGPTLGTAAQKT